MYMLLYFVIISLIYSQCIIHNLYSSSWHKATVIHGKKWPEIPNNYNTMSNHNLEHFLTEVKNQQMNANNNLKTAYDKTAVREFSFAQTGRSALRNKVIGLGVFMIGAPYVVSYGTSFLISLVFSHLLLTPASLVLGYRAMPMLRELCTTRQSRWNVLQKSLATEFNTWRNLLTQWKHLTQSHMLTELGTRFTGLIQHFECCALRSVGQLATGFAEERKIGK
jgi:hypothetical protein